MRNLTLATLGFVALTALSQQTQAPLEVTAEPHHHNVLDNTFVRVYAVEVEPGQSSLMHRHAHDYLSVSIGDAQITNSREGAQPATVNLKDGDVRFTAAPLVHAVSNPGDKPFRNRTIELMQPTTNQKACTESCAVPVPCDSADKTVCPSLVKLFTADQWSVTMVTLPPGAKYPQHSHPGNYLSVPLADADVTVKRQDQPETVVHYKTGEVKWNSPVAHAATNNGKTTARIVVLEFRQ